MNDNDHRGLLPAGLADLLPPDAAREARAIDVAIERFAAFGYERVKPPLVEFEESLLGGPGAALAPQTFRLMDPVSQRMMGVRPDMTVQVVGDTAIVVILLEYIEVDRSVHACIDAGTTCWPEPSAFARFAIYASIGMAEVFLIFTISLAVERRISNRNYAPEWRR